MKERTIKLTLDEGDPFKSRHVFLVTINDNGAEIRAAGSPIASRDSSILTYVGMEPSVVDLVVSVEEVP